MRRYGVTGRCFHPNEPVPEPIPPEDGYTNWELRGVTSYRTKVLRVGDCVSNRDPMTTPDLDHLDALHAKATSPVFVLQVQSNGLAIVGANGEHIFEDFAKHPALSADDAASMVALHNAYPALAAEIRALRAQDSVRSGSWCKGNRDEGRGECGLCPWCCRSASARAIAAEVERDALAKRVREAEALAEAEFAERKRISEASDRAVIAANEKALEHLEARIRAEAERDALREVARIAQARCDDADPRWAPELRDALAKVPK